MKMTDKDEIVKAISLLLKNELLPEKDVLSLLKTIKKATRKENNIYRKAFFTEPSFSKNIIKIGEKYITSDKITEQILWILGQICWRYNVEDNDIFEFFVRQIQNSNKKVMLALESGIIFMPQFDNYDNKWNFILQMPTISPKNESMRLFRIAIEKRVSDIPEKFRGKFIQILNDFISTKNLDIDTLNLYQTTINKI